MSDQNIERGIVEFLKTRQIQGLTVLNVHVERGTATVSGSAQSTYAKIACRECCRRVTGVRAVVDRVDLAAA
jgi:osmotically-inducible protein OsmY